MAERPIHQTEPYSLREEYQPLLTRDIRPHFEKTHDQLYKMFTTSGEPADGLPKSEYI